MYSYTLYPTYPDPSGPGQAGSLHGTMPPPASATSFQLYGPVIRPEPDTVLFSDPRAYLDIYGMKSNVRRGHFYTALRRKSNEHTTLNTIDVDEHARKRKLLNLAFTDKSLRAAAGFIVRHVDRWHEVMLEEHSSATDWSHPVDFAEKVDTLAFDIMGDLSFGKSFDIKEPGDNPLRVIPHNIAEYMRFYYPVSLSPWTRGVLSQASPMPQFCRSPFLKFLIWLKPRGLDQFFDLITPPAVKHFNDFVHDSVTSRIALQKEQAQKPEGQRRQDVFYFLCEARDPDTGLPAYGEDDLRAEASMLIIAGSDTTAVSLSGLFFYLTGDPRRCQKLADEILSAFDSAEDIVHGPKLLGCGYLRACIDEALRLAPSGPCELPREVLPGGIRINGEFYPAGTIVGTVPWVSSRNEEVWGDAGVFRPERWIADEASGITAETLAGLRAGFHPFQTGPTSCVGKNVGMAEIMITVARTLHRFEIRRAPGSTLGGGGHELGWGARDRRQFQLEDAFISLRQGPEVQFRKRSRRV